jgi:hypothetical protein
MNSIVFQCFNILIFVFKVQVKTHDGKPVKNTRSSNFLSDTILKNENSFTKQDLITKFNLLKFDDQLIDFDN